MAKEKWLPVPEYEGIYEVSDHGRIKRISSSTGTRAGKILRPWANTHGYFQVTLYGNRRQAIAVHALVARTFIPNPLNLPQVNHKNGIKSRNTTGNLEWCSPKQNIAHAHLSGFMHPPKGEDHWNATLTDSERRDVISKYESGGETYRSLAKEFGLKSHAAIGQIIRRHKINQKF